MVKPHGQLVLVSSTPTTLTHQPINVLVLDGPSGPSRGQENSSWEGFRLDAFSGYPVEHSYRAMRLAHNPNTRGSSTRSSRTGAASLNSPTPTADRDRTVSRRSKPSSRTTLNGEQPYPWDRLQPQDVMSRHRGAKHRRRCELLGGISLLSPGTFYPLSDGPSIQNHRITKTYFRTCSSCQTRSQARLCLYTNLTISDRD